MEDEIFTLILEAKNEASAALEQVRADVSRMAGDIERANIIAGQSFNELNTQTGLMERGLAKAAAGASTHAAAIESHLSQAARNVSSSFTALESDITALGGTLLQAGILTAPLAIAGGESIKFAADYEQAMNKIRGLTGATQADIALWTPALVEMSKNGTKSATELAAAMYFISSTGLHGADALHVLQQAQEASTGGMGSMDVIANALGGTLNAYVAQADRAGKATEYMDKITMAVVQGHMNPETLAPALSRVTPIAAAAGVPVADVLAALATETHIGGSVDQGATGLRAIMTTLMAPGPASQKALEGMGMDAATSGRRLREEGLQQYLAEIDAASLAEAGGDRDRQDAILKKLFPQARTALPMMLALTRTGGDIESGGGDSNFFKQIDDSITNNSGGITHKASETALEGFNAQMQVLKNNVDAVGIAFGQQLIPVLTPLVKDLAPALVTMLTQFANDALRVGQVIVGIAQGFGSLAAAVGLSIDPLRVVEGVLLGMSTVAIVSVAGAIGGLVLDVGRLVFSLGGLAVAFFTMDAAAVSAAVASTTAWLAAAAPITLLIAAGATLVLAWTNNWFGIQQIVGSALQFIGEHIGLVASVIFPFIALPGLVFEAWSTNFLGIREVVSSALGFIAEKIAGLLDLMASNPVSSEFFHVPKDWREQWGAVAATISDAVSGAGSAVSDATQGIRDRVGDAANAVGAKKDEIAAAIAQMRAALDNLQKPGAIDNGDAQAKIKQIIDDLNATQSAAAGAGAGAPAPETTAAPNAAALEKTALEKDLLELKRQSLALEGQMIGPQQVLRDLQLQMRDAANEQLKLTDEKRLLDLDAADFNQNADLKRIANKISQDQEQLDFTRSPAQAAALAADIERLKVQAHDIKVGMFGSQDARTEADIISSGDALQVKLAQNPIAQQVAAATDALKGDEARKRAIDDAIKRDEHQQAVDKLNAELNPSSDVPRVPITPRDAAGVAAATATLPDDRFHPGERVGGRTPDPDLTTRLGGSGPQIVINISNPVLTTDQNQQQVAAQMLAVLDHGLTEMIASGTPLPVWNGNPSGN